MDPRNEQEQIRRAMDNALSGLRGDPWLARRVLERAKGEGPVKKKISAALIIAIALILVTASVALAAGLGLFGELADSPSGDGRLSALDGAAEPVGLEWTTLDVITLRIEQAYFEGDRVFISYRMTGPYAASVLHEGAPEEAYAWSDEEETVAAEEMMSDIPARQEVILQLDGTAPRWAEFTDAGLHDGLFLADGTYLDIIGGDIVVQADGSLIGWKECEIPEDVLEDTMTFRAVLFRTRSVLFQDGPVLRSFSGRAGEDAGFDFTLTRTADLTRLTGEGNGEAYAAAADFTAGHIDLRGTVTVECPASWVAVWDTWENPDGVDLIEDWFLYRGGELVSDEGLQAIWSEDETHLVFELVFSAAGGTDGLSLVPVFSDWEPRLECAIPLNAAE